MSKANSYLSARRDFETLEGILDLEDQVELDSNREALMRNPTREFAAELYESAIRLWFDQNKEASEDPIAVEIAERRNIKRSTK